MICWKHARRTHRELGWLFAMLLLPCPVAADEPALIPAGANVALVSGVAGDLESDTLYTANVRNWMDLARRAGAARIMVLCENPAALKLPAESATNTFRANREDFLALRQHLAGTTNPLVVVAWGHGGRQGPTPVLHVRGPRLRPADFEELADDRQQVASTWILMFRGSGAFARELAGPNRIILASEHQTQFASDPGGLANDLYFTEALHQG